MDKRRYHSPFGFTDLLFNLLIGITFLFILAFILIKPSEEAKKIETKAEYLITLEWPDHHNGDVDLWVQDPYGAKIGFASQEKNVTSLERDDLGSATDTHKDRYGNVVYNPVNREVITVRGIQEGEWVVNVHYYGSRPIPEGHVSGQITPPYEDRTKIPVEVEVKVIKLNPSYQTLITKKIVLTFQGEERTMARFILDKEGNLVQVLEAPYKFVIGVPGEYGP